MGEPFSNFPNAFTVSTSIDYSNLIPRQLLNLGLPLNNENFDLKVNMLKCEETDKKGETKRFSWVTDLPLDRDTVMPIMRAGRHRWAIENETIKTLKDRRGYNFEHNYGHGSNHLADVFPTFSTLALLMDQVQQFCCRLFQQARDYQKGNLYLWDSIRCFLRIFNFPDWRPFYLALSGKLTKGELAELLIGGP